jgi:hypothetical protein
VLVEVHGHAEHAVAEVEQLVGEGRGQPAHAGDAVAGLQDTAHLLGREPGLVALQHVLDRVGDVFRPDRQIRHRVLFLVVWWLLVVGCG